MHKSPTATDNFPPPAFYIHPFSIHGCAQTCGELEHVYFPACTGHDGQVTSLSQG